MRRFTIRLLSCALLLLLAACNLGVDAQATPVPTPDIPTVEILSPVNNQQVREGIMFDLDIVGRDPGAGIERIELFIDDQKINEATPLEAEAVAVFRVTMNWLAQGVGRHVVEAIAYRADGTPSDPFTISIEVLALD